MREGYLARHPGVGLVAFLLGMLVFSILAFNVVTNGPLLAWDKPVDLALYQRASHDPSISQEAMRFSGNLGTYYATGIGLLMAIILIFKKRWYALSMLVLGVMGGAGWFYVLSRAFGRPRPVLPTQLDPISVPGFPSGHCMTAVLLYGLILYLLFPHLHSTWMRILATIDMVAIMLLIGYSRLYLGSHYPTDVIGGFAFGLSWAALVYTGIELFRYRRSASRKISKGMPLKSS